MLSTHFKGGWTYEKSFARNILLVLIICTLSVFNFTGCNNSDKKKISYPCTFSSGSASVKLIDENNCKVTNVYNGSMSGYYNTTISGSGTWSISGDYVIIELSEWKIKDSNGRVILDDSSSINMTLKAKIESSSKITYLGKTYKME